MKIITVVGARPQFIKCAPLSPKLAELGTHKIIHTGQHFDPNMSAIFFEEMQIPKPDYELNISGGDHGAQTGRMIIEIEKILLQERPDVVVVFGDTNSTLAAGLAASKQHIPVFHVEAGLRSFDHKMPEEINRVLTDHLATWLSCPSDKAVEQLSDEGITKNVENTGDIMLDATQYFLKKAGQNQVEEKIDWPINPKEPFALLTLHRASNTDNPTLLRAIFEGLSEANIPMVFPVHPRTRKALAALDIKLSPNIHLVDPVGYMEMLVLIDNARWVITDSGGLQKEAFFLDTQCITLRDTTEWSETVVLGWNELVLSDSETFEEALLLEVLKRPVPDKSDATPYGKGQASEAIVRMLTHFDS